MDSNIKDYNPTLITYMDTLENQSKFKAKVLYTLTCIQNSLGSSGAAYMGDLIFLSKHQGKLLEIANLHRDYSILQQMANIFYKFEQAHIINICSKQYLDIIHQNVVEGNMTDGFVEHVCKLLSILKHRYAKTKQICMKLLECSNNNKITQNQCNLLLETMTNASLVSKDECGRLAQCGSIGYQQLLQLLWKSCLVSGSCKNTSGVEYGVIGKCMDEEWHNEVVRYKSMRISIWNNTSETGNIQKLVPQYIDLCYKHNPKPSYKPNSQTKPQQFQNILQYVATQFYCNAETHPKLKQQIKSAIIPKYSKDREKQQILSAICEGVEISAMNQNKYLYVIPIQYLTAIDAIINKLTHAPTPENAYKVMVRLHIIEKINIHSNVQKFVGIYMKILHIYLCHKQCSYLKVIQQIITEKFKNKDQILKNLFIQNPENIVLLPCVAECFSEYNQKQKQQINKNIDKFINNQNIHIQYKFYVANYLIKMQLEEGVSKFIFYLLRNMNKEHLPYQEIAYYLRHNTYDKQHIQWLYSTFQQEIQRVQEKIFGRLVDHDFKAPKQIIFALQKYNIFEQWHPIYRWTLNPLDQPNFENPQALIDSFQVFQTVIQNSKHVQIQVIKKFFLIVAKHWEHFTHHHMFTIQRISRSLFSDQELNAHDLEQVTNYLKSLMQRPWKMAIPELYRQSLALMIKNTLMEEIEEIDETLLNTVFAQLTKIQATSLKNYQNLRNKLFAQQLLMWRFQYQEATIHQKVAQSLIKIINNYEKFQIVNQCDRQLLVQNSLQIISTVSHECNLLEISLTKILRYYPTNKNILLFVIEIVCSIKQVNLKALAKFQLQKFIPQLLSTLIFSKDDELNKNYIQLLQESCGDKQSPYYAVFNKSKNLLVQIIRIEGILALQASRPDVTKFAINNLININKQQNTKIQSTIHKKWIQNIWIKYYSQEQLKSTCQGILSNLKEETNLMTVVDKMKKQNQDFSVKKKQEKTKQIKLKQAIKIQQVKSTPKIVVQNSNKVQQQIKNKCSKPPVLTAMDQQDKQEKVQSQKQKKAQLNQFQSVKPKVVGKLGISLNNNEQTEHIVPSPPKIGQSVKQKEGGFGFGFAKVPKTKSLKNDNVVKRKRVERDQQQMQNINNIKNSVNLIGSFADSKANPQQKAKLAQAFVYLADVVSIHPYYCQKVANLGVVNKTISLSLQVQTQLLDKILQLFLQISENKEKNLTIFNDTKSIDFFKRVLKQSIVSRKQLPANQMIIKIISKCWNSSNDFFTNGLLSMLFEMAKIDLNRQQTLQLLSKNQLSYQIVNQIYQRGLFIVMQVVFKKDLKDLTEKDKIQICHWTRLMGKVCLNNSIRQKLYSIQFHNLVYNKIQVLHELSCVHNLAFLFANFTYEFPKIASWCKEKNISEYFIQQMNEYDKIPTQFYRFFRYFSQNGNQYIQYLFKINYHTRMIQVLTSQQQKISVETFKHFYKSLSHLFVPEFYQLFLKMQLVRILVQKYQTHRSHHILQCLSKLVNQVKNKSDLEMLQKQKLWSLNSVFNSKIKDDLSYPFYMDIYIDLLKKFKNVDCKLSNLQLANKLIRKGIFTINMQGKRKAMQLLNILSEIDKTCYSNANCLRVFQSLINYNIGVEQLDLLILQQQIQTKYKKAIRTNQQQLRKQQQKFPLRFKNMNQIKAQTFLDTLINKFLQLRKQVETTQNAQIKQKNLVLINKIVQVFIYFSKFSANRKQIYNKLSNILLRTCSAKENYQSSLKIVAELSEDKQIANLFSSGSAVFLPFVQNVYDYLASMKNVNDELIGYFKILLQSCLKYNLIERSLIQDFIQKIVRPGKLGQNSKIKEFVKQSSQIKSQQEISQSMKGQMINGIKVKMYKQDGSNSSLTLRFTIDLLEINCVLNISDPPKSKWRLTLTEIQTVKLYTNLDDYKQSTFYLSEGIFTKPPPMQNCLTLKGKSKNFYICFETVPQLQLWKKYIELARVRASHLLFAIRR